MNGDERRCLLDTNAVVALLQGHPSLLRLTQQAEWIGISVITQLEFLSFPSLPPEDEALFSHFIARVDIVNLEGHNHTLLSQASTLRQQHLLKLPDAVVVDTALSKDAALVTADRRLLNLAEYIGSLRVCEFTS